MGRRLEVVEVYRCMDCGGLINYENDECSCKTSTKNQRKKDEKVASRIAHLETRSVQEEDNTQVKCKTKDVDNLVDTDNLTNPELDSVTRLDGCRTNPQDCSRQANVAAKEDTNKSVLPADSKSKSDVEELKWE